VIYAILFLGAFQQLALGLEAGRADQIVMSITYAILVFNDGVYTSYFVDVKRKVKYTAGLMFIDLINFLLLAWAMICINPTQNAFGLTMDTSSFWLSDGVFWGILTVYWSLVIFWTMLAGRYNEGYPRRLFLASIGIILVFAVQSAIEFAFPPVIEDVSLYIAATYLASYILLLRPLWSKSAKPFGETST